MNFILIKKEIKKLIKKYKNFLVGYSGGLDSTILLYLLKKNKKKNNNIRAIHINHNTNYLCIKWEKHCIKFCKKIKIQLIIKRIFNKYKKNIENNLRNERYNIYKKYIKKNEILLTAHHKNDQLETILLSLKRGCGIEGLIGIKKKNKINNITIIRPFLNINKKEIKKYAIKKNIKWIEDPSNKNINLDRNFLRIKIIPIINKKWPFFISSIIRTSKICSKQKEIIDNFIKKKIKNNIKKKILFLKKILKLKKQEIILILRKFIILNKKKQISYKLINLLANKIIKNKKKKYFQINLKEFNINKYKNKLYISKKIKNIDIKKILWNKKYKYIKLPNKIGIIYINNKYKKKYNNKNTVRKPFKNENIYIKFNIKKKIKILNKKKKKIKKIWQEYKILPWKRKFIPIIFYNKKPILSPNIFITKYGNPKKYKKWNIIFKEK